MKSAFWAGFLGILAGVAILAACGGSSGGTPGGSAATLDDLEMRVAAIEAQQLDSRLTQAESTLSAHATDLAALADTVDALGPLRLTCHESATVGPFNIDNTIGGAQETLKEVTFTPSVEGGTALLFEVCGEVTPLAFVEQTRLQLEVSEVRDGVEGLPVAGQSITIRAESVGELVLNTFRLHVNRDLSNPLPDSYKVRLTATSTSTDWSGDATNVVFKVIEVEMDTTVQANSSAIQ